MPAPDTDGALDARLTEMMLFVGGGLATLLVLALAIWLFVRATREEAEREEAERREREATEGRREESSADPARRRACAEGYEPPEEER